MKQIKFFATALLMLFFAVSVVAQTHKVSSRWENPTNENLQGANIYLGLLYEDDKSCYLLTEAKNGRGEYNYQIVECNKKSLKTTTKRIWNNERPITNLYYFGGEAYALMIENPTRSLKEPALYALRKLDKSSMAFEAKPILALTGFETIVFSPDSSKMLLVAKSDNKEWEEIQFHLCVFDSKPNRLWDKEITSPFTHVLPLIGGEATFPQPLSFAVDNSGNAYISGRVYPNTIKKKDSEKEKDYYFSLLKISPDGESKELKLAANNLFLNKAAVNIDKDNRLLITGFYSDKANLKKAGACYFYINKDFSQIENLNTIEIPLEHQTLYLATTRKKQSIKKEVERRFEDWNYTDVLYDGQGNMYLCAERKEIWEAGGSSSAIGPSVMSAIYYAYDTYILKVTPDKNLAWTKRIPKAQIYITEGITDGSNRIGHRVMLSSSGNIVVLFLDSPTNFKVKDDAKVQETSTRTSGRKADLVYVELDQNGNATKQIVANSQEAKMYAVLKTACLLNDNSLLLIARKDKSITSNSEKCKLGVITVK
ncbi:MAG: hypothetical protein LBR81_01075 [Prevotellaceae bacterium]|jgi:hypothetical protein|nr:hypothetical protein [Prevotellaceae bacterium]